nr:putative reverse transcriptase domain-containing protein [Tanacetum cinerariifolium]
MKYSKHKKGNGYIIPLDEIHIDDKLHFIEEPVEIIDREVKRLKQSRIPIVMVKWNSRRAPEFMREREDQFQKKYPHLFAHPALHQRPRLESTSRGVHVGPKVGFKPHKEYRHVPKKPNASSSGNKKKGVKPTIEVSNSNPFDILNSIDNDVELGTNGGTTNLVNNEANSSGFSFMNVDNSSTGTTLIINKIGKFEDLLSSGQAILTDNAGNPLKNVEFSGDYDSEDEVASVDNDMACSLASERVGFLALSPKLKSWSLMKCGVGEKVRILFLKLILAFPHKLWSSPRVPFNHNNRNATLLQPLDLSVYNFHGFFNEM